MQKASTKAVQTLSMDIDCSIQGPNRDMYYSLDRPDSEDLDPWSQGSLYRKWSTTGSTEKTGRL